MSRSEANGASTSARPLLDVPLLRHVPRHAAIASTAGVSRVTNAAVQLVSIPILISHLGVEQYAAFAVLLSLLPWFGLTDMGLGPALQNYVSEQRAAGRPYGHHVRAAAGLLLVILIVSIGAMLVLAAPASSLLFANIQLPPDLQPHILLALVWVVFSIEKLSSVAYRYLYAQHHGYVIHVNQMAGSLVGLGLVLVLTRAFETGAGLPWLLAAWTLPNATLAFVTALLVFLRAGRRAADKGRVAGPIAKRAARFQVFAVLSVATLSVDYLVMSQTLAPKEIATYNITAKIFGFVFFLYNALMMALWPVLAERFARAEVAQARRTMIRNAAAGAAVVVVATALILIFRDTLSQLLSPNVPLSIAGATVLLFGFYYVLRVWCDTIAAALMSMTHLRPFYYYMPVQTALSIGLQYALSLRYGIDGIVLGLILSFLLTAVWVLPIAFWHQQKRVYARAASMS